MFIKKNSLMKKILQFTMVIAVVLITAGSMWAQGVPHPLYVEVQNGSSVSPATGDLTFEAWLTNDPSSVLTESSTGCFYTAPPGCGVECGNFAQAWTAGDVVHIEVEQTSTGDVGTGEFTLTFDNFQMFSGVDGIIIAPIPLPSEVWVDDNYTSGSCGGHSWEVDAFDNITYGIAAVAEAGIVNVAAGPYDELIYIDKTLTLLGPNFDKSGTDNTRVSEAIISFPSGLTEDFYELIAVGPVDSWINVNDVVIKGFTIDGYSTETFEATGIMGNSDGLVVENNIIKNFNYGSVWVSSYVDDGGSWNYSDYNESATIKHNYIHNDDIYDDFVDSNYPWGIYLQGTYGEISNNVVEGVRLGIQIQPYNHPNTGNLTGMVSGNTFEGYQLPVWFNYSENTNANWSIISNILIGIAAPPGLPQDEWTGFRISALRADGVLDFSGNTINYGTADATSIVALKKYATVFVGMIDLDNTFADNTWERCVVISDGTNILDPVSTDVYFYADIQSAIDEATTLAGYFIEVAAGTYVENVVIDVPNLTLQSTAGYEETIIDNPSTTGSETSGIYVWSNLGIVTVDGFTANNFRNGIIQSYTKSVGTSFIVKNCKVIPENNGTTPYLRNGIQVSGDESQVIDNIVFGAPLTEDWSSSAIGIVNASNVLVQGNTVTGPADIGICINNYNSALVDHITINDNQINGAGSGVTIEASSNNSTPNVQNVFITNNTLENSQIEGQGVNVERVTLTNLTVTGNEITGNDYAGIRFSDESATIAGNILINENDLSGNTSYGIFNGTTTAVDATCNWWGSDDAYDVADEVSGLAQFLPFRTVSVAGDCNGVGPVVNTTQDISYMTIQAAIDDADPGDVINVDAGLYLEDLQISENLTLLGPKASTARNTGSALDWTLSTTASWSQPDAVSAGEAVIRSASASAPAGLTSSAVVHIHEGYDVSVKGFVIEARNRVNSTNVHLVYVEGKDATINSVAIENNIIGPITGELQDGTKGRMGLALDSQSGGNNGLSGSVKGNKIFGAEGNGDNVFVIGSHYDPSMSDYSGMIIENNDIYGTNRSGLELCGGIDGLTVQNNFVAYSGLIWDGTDYVESSASISAPTNIKYGIGINLIRTGTIAGTYPPTGQNYLENLSITGNAISNSSKMGIYAGPMQRDLTISGNTLSDNGWDGIWLDESGTYNANKTYHEAYGYMDGVSVFENAINDATGTYAGVRVTGKPVDLSVTTNDISGNAKGIIQYDGDGQSWDYTVPATCNWWGSTDSYDVADAVSGDVQFLPFSTVSSPTNCLGVGPVVNTSQTLSYMTIQEAINDANPTDVIVAAAGTYDENVVVNKAITLNGNNADIACGSRVTETIIAPTSGLPVLVTADGVTLNGFEITAPTYPNAIVCGNTSDLDIMFNKIHDIYTTGSGSNAHAINYTVSNSPAATEDVNILDNCFSDIGNIDNSGKSARAIGVLQSTTTGTLTGLTIDGNTITNVFAKKLDWSLGGRIAYGIQINVGGGSSYQTTTGNVVNAAITDNEISNLEGFISTGIGLEGNTENAVVTGNSISTLTGYKLADRTGGGYDLNGLKFENNNYVASVTVEDNVFGADTFVYDGTSNLGYAVANYVPTTVGTADVSCNWFGTATLSEIVDNETLTGKIFNKEGCETNFLPVWTTTTGPCDGVGPVVVYESTTTTIRSSHMTIQDGVDAAVAGDVIEVAAGTYAEDVDIDKGIELRGANYVVAANDPTDPFNINPSRVSESILDGTFDLKADDITIDGFAVTGTGYAIHASVDGVSNIILQNNYMYSNTGGQTVRYWTPAPAENWTLSYNRITDVQADDATAVALFNITNLTISNNTILHTNSDYEGRRGMNIDGGQTVGISKNTIDMGLDNPVQTPPEYPNFYAARYPLQISGSHRPSKNVTIDYNAFSGAYDGIITLGNNSVTGLLIDNNNFSDFIMAIRFRAGTNTSTALQSDIDVLNNSFADVSMMTIRFGTDDSNLYDDIAINYNMLTGGGSYEIYLADDAAFVNQIDATLNYWGGCPSVAGDVDYFPYYTDEAMTTEVTNITTSADITICAGSSTTISAGNGSNFYWDNGLGLGTSKVVSPNTTTVYTVTGDDSEGCPGGEASVTVTVVDAPAVTIVGPSVVGIGDFFTLIATAGYYSYDWDGDGIQNETYPYEFDTRIDRTSTFTVKVTNAAGCYVKESITVSVAGVNAGPNQFSCSGAQVTLSATAFGFLPTSYTWTPGDLMGASVNVSPTTTTTYTVTATDGTIITTDQVKVFVYAAPIADAGDDITIAASGILNGSASGGTAPYTYAWTGPASFSVQNPTVTLAGIYTLTVTDGNGCTNTDEVVVSVAENGVTVSGNVSYAFGSINEQMHDVEIILTGTGDYAGTNYSTTTASTGNGDYEFVGVANGTYEVSLNSPKPWGGVNFSDLYAIVYHYYADLYPSYGFPQIPNSIKLRAADVNNDGIVNMTDYSVLYARMTGTALDVGDWVFMTDDDNAFDYDNTTTPYANNAYTSSDKITIAVSGAAVTQNFKGLCYGDVDASNTGMKESELENPEVWVNLTEKFGLMLESYPNPFQGSTTLNYLLPVDSKVTLEVYNLMGVKVDVIAESMPQTHGLQQIEYNNQGLQAGVYIVVLSSTSPEGLNFRQNAKWIVTK